MLLGRFALDLEEFAMCYNLEIGEPEEFITVAV